MNRKRYQPVSPQTSTLSSEPSPLARPNSVCRAPFMRSDTSTAQYGSPPRKWCTRSRAGVAAAARGRWNMVATSDWDGVKESIRNEGNGDSGSSPGPGSLRRIWGVGCMKPYDRASSDAIGNSPVYGSGSRQTYNVRPHAQSAKGQLGRSDLP